MMPVRRIDDLLAPWVSVSTNATSPLTGISLDSRDVTPGGLFLALAGAHVHGIDFLDSVLTAGAAVVVFEPSAGVSVESITKRCQAKGVQAIGLPDLPRYVSEIAARFYGYPGHELRLIAVTGTDGKSSVAHYLTQIFDRLGSDSAVMGTLGWGRLSDLQPTQHTTTDPITVQARLAALVAEGVRSVVMEVSSHALAQYRVEAVPFATAILTTMGRDHLDYHGCLEAYHAAKRRLFAWPTLELQILNSDDAVGRELAVSADASSTVRTYGWAADADYRLTTAQPRRDGLDLVIDHAGTRSTIHLALLGRFNAMNAVAALAAAVDDQPMHSLLPILSELQPVPGRMERFIAPAKPLVVVDYAHTPGALEAALTALREHTTGKLWCVFGCGGERDRGKRPLMGEVAARLADHIVLTNDNPRGEPEAGIIDEIRAGIANGHATEVISDRYQAIASAINQAAAGDTVLVAGKGHETEQCLADRRLDFSDRDTADALLQRRAS